MSDKDSSAPNAAEFVAKLTSAETKFFTVIFKYLPKNLDIDWNGFAEEMGFKGGNIAKVRIHALTSSFFLPSTFPFSALSSRQ